MLLRATSTSALQESMRGVLDLGRSQQVDLSARVDSLTHRITAAVSGGQAMTPRASSAASGSAAASQSPSMSQPAPLTSTAQGIIIALSRASRQQEALIEQHTLLKQELRRASDVTQQNAQLRLKVRV